MAQIIPTLLVAAFIVDRKAPLQELFDPDEEEETEKIFAENTEEFEHVKLSRELGLDVKDQLTSALEKADLLLGKSLSKRKRREVRIERAKARMALRKLEEETARLRAADDKLTAAHTRLAAASRRRADAFAGAQKNYTHAMVQCILLGFITEMLALLGALGVPRGNLTLTVQVVTVTTFLLIATLSIYAAQKLLLYYEWKWKLSADAVVAYLVYAVLFAAAILVVATIRVAPV